ncbi:MAG: 50S ribosomal protein L22 [Candidatus Moraniibacteriota bacterium]|nr:MAG: 50S ribosomal protein L22 [Candidatus Moranbacteria bacterium]
MTKVTAQLNNIRISPRKVRLVADRVRGVNVNEAIAILKYDMRKTAQPMEKLLKSAVANAENNFKLKSEDLVVSDITVGEGPTLKRWMPRAYGRASKIFKRTSRINVVLTEKEENDVKKEVINNAKEDKSASKKKTKADKK